MSRRDHGAGRVARIRVVGRSRSRDVVAIGWTRQAWYRWRCPSRARRATGRWLASGMPATDFGAPPRPTSGDPGPRDPRLFRRSRRVRRVSARARSRSRVVRAGVRAPQVLARSRAGDHLPASAITTPAALRDILSRRVRAVPPRVPSGRLPPRGARRTLPLLRAHPHARRIGHRAPPRLSPVRRHPHPPTAGSSAFATIFTPTIDPASPLLRSIDAGRLPRGLLDGVPGAISRAPRSSKCATIADATRASGKPRRERTSPSSTQPRRPSPWMPTRSPRSSTRWRPSRAKGTTGERPRIARRRQTRPPTRRRGRVSSGDDRAAVPGPRPGGGDGA